MKNKIWSIFLAFFLLLSLAAPADAALDYGLIYDETELIWTEELAKLGEETMPGFVEKYGIDVRVDILTTAGEYETLYDAAENIYSNYAYGGPGGNGVSLTLLVNQDEENVSMDGWCLYFGGESAEWTVNAPANIPLDVDTYLSEEAWAGDNIQDAKALAQAISSILQGLESFVQGGGVADSIWSPVSGFVFEDSSEAVESTENEVAAESEAPGAPTVEVSVAADEDPQLDNVTDAAGLLTDEEWQKLEQKARDISVAHDFGVYIITVDDYKEYSDGRILDACKTIYDDYNLGMGEDRDGVVLMLSMRDRDYTLMCDGSFGNYAFTDAGREDLTEFFLDNFSDDDWYGGFDDYLDAADDFLVNAEEGNPYSEDHPAMSSSDRILGIAIRVAIILLVPLIIAFIWVAVLTSKMKSVAAAVEASTYVSGQLHLNQSYEHYTYSTETRTKIESSSGGGSSSGSSGSASGTSGKF